jgi:hypothetical protein
VRSLGVLQRTGQRLRGDAIRGQPQGPRAGYRAHVGRNSTGTPPFAPLTAFSVLSGAGPGQATFPRRGAAA